MIAITGFISILLITGISLANPESATAGDTVNVTYSLSFPGGPVFDTNSNSSPLSFVLGSGAVISGFDAAVMGMTPGETKTVILQPKEAYGERNESLVQIRPLMETVDMLDNFTKANVSVGLIPGYPGPVIEYLPPEGKRQRYVFTNITNESVTVDTNKPLTGESLQFEITLVEIINKA